MRSLEPGIRISYCSRIAGWGNGPEKCAWRTSTSPTCLSGCAGGIGDGAIGSQRLSRLHHIAANDGKIAEDKFLNRPASPTCEPGRCRLEDPNRRNASPESTRAMWWLVGFHSGCSYCSCIAGAWESLARIASPETSTAPQPCERAALRSASVTMSVIGSRGLGSNPSAK